MANEKVKPNVLFAVLLALAGSLTIGDHRITPFQATAVPKELADRVDTTVNPVQFFETEEAAQKKVGELRAQKAAKAARAKGQK